MKAKFEDFDVEDDFQPFKATLTIMTREEARIFHNEVAIKIASHSEFIGQAYRRIDGRSCGTYECEVPLR